MDTSKIAKQQAELINRLDQFPTGKSRSGGKAGGYIDVVLDKPIPGQPKSVRAKCGGDCPPGAIQVIKADNGEYIALSPNAAQETSSTTTRESSTKIPQNNQSVGKIKILFSIIKGRKQLFYIGGDTPKPRLIYEREAFDLASPLQNTQFGFDTVCDKAYIVNQGKGKNDWLVSLQYEDIDELQPENTDTIQYLSTKTQSKDPNYIHRWYECKTSIYRGGGVFVDSYYPSLPTVLPSDPDFTSGGTNYTQGGPPVTLPDNIKTVEIYTGGFRRSGYYYVLDEVKSKNRAIETSIGGGGNSPNWPSSNGDWSVLLETQSLLFYKNNKYFNVLKLNYFGIGASTTDNNNFIFSAKNIVTKDNKTVKNISVDGNNSYNYTVPKSAVGSYSWENYNVLLYGEENSSIYTSLKISESGYISSGSYRPSGKYGSSAKEEHLHIQSGKEDRVYFYVSTPDDGYVPSEQEIAIKQLINLLNSPLNFTQNKFDLYRVNPPPDPLQPQVNIPVDIWTIKNIDVPVDYYTEKDGYEKKTQAHKCFGFGFTDKTLPPENQRMIHEYSFYP